MSRRTGLALPSQCQKRRFRAGKMKRPAIGGGGQEDWNNGTMEYWNDGLGIDRLPQYSNIPVLHHSIGLPEAPACGWFFDLSAHGRRRVWCRAEGSSLKGVVEGRGAALPPEPPLLLGLGRACGRPLRGWPHVSPSIKRNLRSGRWCPWLAVSE